MKRMTAVLGLFALLACAPAIEVEPVAALPDDAPPEEFARVAAVRWLRMLDAANYGDTWQAASDMFRIQVPAGQWEEAGRQVRQQVGTVVERELMLARFETRIPNAPVGEYVVLQYRTAFSRRPSMSETVTMQKEPDGVWRVSGYFVTQN